jgi:hypothetical protein
MHAKVCDLLQLHYKEVTHLVCVLPLICNYYLRLSLGSNEFLFYTKENLGPPTSANSI